MASTPGNGPQAHGAHEHEGPDELRDAAEQAQQRPGKAVEADLEAAPPAGAPALDLVEDAPEAEGARGQQTEGETDEHRDGRSHHRDLDGLEGRADHELQEVPGQLGRVHAGEEPPQVLPAPGLEEESRVHLGPAPAIHQQEEEQAAEDVGEDRTWKSARGRPVAPVHGQALRRGLRRRDRNRVAAGAAALPGPRRCRTA